MTAIQDAPAAEMPAPRDRMMFLAAAVAAYLLMGALQAVYGPALPILARETGRGLGEVSQLYSLHWIGGAIAVVASFLLGVRLKPRFAVFVVALGAAILGSGLISPLSGWQAMLAGAMVAGFGQTCVAVLFNARLLRVFGARGPGLVSLINAIYGAGAIAGPLMLVALSGDFRLLFLILAAGLFLALPAAGNVGASPVTATAGRAALRPDWPLLVIGALGIGIEALLVGLGPGALVRAGYDETAAAGLLSAFFVSFLLARLGLSLVAHRIRPLQLLQLAGLGTTAAMLFAAFVAPGTGFVLAGVFAALFFPGYFVAGIARMGHDARVAPLIVAGGQAGGIVLPFILARMLPGLPVGGYFVAVALVAAAAFGGALMIRR